MNPTSPTSDDTPELRQAALEWFVRREAEDWSEREEVLFQEWLDAGEGRRELFAQCESVWRALDSVPAQAVDTLRHHLQRDKFRESVEPGASGWLAPGGQMSFTAPSRRRFLMPVFATAAVASVASGMALMAWNHWQAQPAFAQRFSTQRGQQVEARLPDGSLLRLDASTELEVTYFRQRREVRLLDGQAVFDVRPDPQRPFRVSAGSTGITVLGTRFSVRYTPNLPGEQDVRVSVEEGRVHVALLDGRGHEARAQSEEGVYLGAGEQVSMSARGVLSPVARVPADGIAPWRENRVSFVNTPLEQALAELGRYRNTGLFVRDPEVASLRLTGTFDPRDVQTLRRVLPQALPVKLLPAGESVEIVSAP